MKKFPVHKRTRGFTIVEMTLVLSIILGLSAIGFLGLQSYNKYSDGLAAGGVLKAVAAAQKSYLSDNPTQTYANLTTDNLAPYMPSGTWPTNYNGYPLPDNCSVNVTVYPPVATLNGATYDPSASTSDGLWDIGPTQ